MFTAEEVAAARARLAERMEQRRHDAEDREVIGIVHRRPFGEVKEQEVTAELVEEPQATHRSQLLLIAFWISCELVRRLISDDWMFALVMVLIGFILFGLRYL